MMVEVDARMSGVGLHDRNHGSPSSICHIVLELLVHEDFTQADLSEYSQRVVLEGTFF